MTKPKPKTKTERAARKALAKGGGRRMFAPTKRFARRFDAWVRARGFRRMEDVAAALGYSYDAVVKWRRGDRLPGVRARRDVDDFMSGAKDLLAEPDDYKLT